MSDNQVTIIEECKCGHDKATHFKDGDCLATHCDCAGFLDRCRLGTYRKQKANAQSSTGNKSSV